MRNSRKPLTCPAPPTVPTVPNATRCTGFKYTTDNQRNWIGYPSGEIITMGYDTSNRQTSVVAKRPAGTTFQSRTYTYTTATGADTDLRLSVTPQSGSATTFSYDALNRVRTATTGTTTKTYNYDPAGNRTSLAVTGQSTTYYGYNNANELCWSGPTSGSNGTTACPATPTGDTAYTSDLNGNITAVGSTAYSYNTKNQTTAIGPTSYSYADVGQSEQTAAGSTSYTNGLLGLASQTAASTVYFTRDPQGNLIGMRTGAGGTSTNTYFTLDALGSVMALTDATGTVDTDARTFDAYGVASGGSSSASPYRFASGRGIGSGSLQKMGDRIYDPALGRWTQRDPVAGAIHNPCSMNRYLYVSDSPTNSTDPSGRFDFGHFFTCAGIDLGLAGAVASDVIDTAALAVGLATAQPEIDVLALAGIAASTTLVELLAEQSDENEC